MEMSIKIQMPRRRCVLNIPENRQKWWSEKRNLVDQQPVWCLGFFQSTDGSDSAEAIALVELEDGRVLELGAYLIKFVDQDEMKEEESTTEVGGLSISNGITSPYAELMKRTAAEHDDAMDAAQYSLNAAALHNGIFH